MSGETFTTGDGFASTNPVTINTATGAVTDIGALPGDTDALAFGPAPASIGTRAVPTLGPWTLLAIALVLAATGSLALRGRRGS